MQDRNLVLQGEYFYRDESGDVLLQEGIDYALFDYSGSQRGYYLQGIYQFMPRWRIGLRYDRLNPDNRLRLVANTTDEGETNWLKRPDFSPITILTAFQQCWTGRPRSLAACGCSTPGTSPGRKLTTSFSCNIS